MPTIYILDYDKDIAYVLCHWFSINGFVAKSFSMAEDLLHQLGINPPDSIILDCLFGGLTATTDFCTTIRNKLHYQGKILLTSTGRFSDKEIQECNAVGCIAKPFDLQEVLYTVTNLMNDSFPKQA